MKWIEIDEYSRTERNGSDRKPWLVELPARGSGSECRGESGAHFIPLTILCQRFFECRQKVWTVMGKEREAMQFDRFPPSKEGRSLTASLGPPERLIAVQIFAADFLKPLLVFSAAFVVRAEIVSAVLY
jgi:hypothetical protein